MKTKPLLSQPLKEKCTNIKHVQPWMGECPDCTPPVVSGDKECDTCHHFLKLHYGSDNTLCIGCDGDRTCKPPVTSSPDDNKTHTFSCMSGFLKDGWECSCTGVNVNPMETKDTPNVNSSPDDVAGRELDVRPEVSTDSWEERLQKEFDFDKIFGKNSLAEKKYKAFIKAELSQQKKQLQEKVEALKVKPRHSYKDMTKNGSRHTAVKAHNAAIDKALELLED